MGYNYAVLGSGRQGTATAYDLALFGQSDLILMADLELAQAERSAARVNKLVNSQVCKPEQLNVKNPDAVVKLLTKHQIKALISGVPYFFNPSLSKAAIQAGSSMCDYGGNTEVVRQQLGMADQARAAGITIIPDCGMAPGMANSLCAHALSLLDEPRDLLIYDCGLPQKPKPPWNYVLTFSIEGLTNEYFGKTNVLRNGEHHQTNCFEEYEVLDFPEPIGQLEAFTTSGGVSTLPWTYYGKLRTVQNKTLRWPGHFVQWKAFQNAGLFELEPVEVDGQNVVPRHVLHALIDPQIRAKESDRDMVIIRIIARGLKEKKETEITLDLFDYFDEKTGFTAMERATGFHAGIMAALMAQGKTAAGALTVETSVHPSVFLEEFNKRGFKVKTATRQLETKSTVGSTR